MGFGKKVGSLKSLKEQLKKGGGGKGFIQFIPVEKDGSITVRFMEEPDEFIQYSEVYDEVKRASWPVPDEGQPGYPSASDRVSKRYLANVVITGPDDHRNYDKVVPLQLPTSLVNQLVVRYEKYGTLLDRDYELFKTGSKLDTEYGLTPESPAKRAMTKYDPLDLMDVLQAAYDSVWGDGADDDDKPAPKRRGSASSRRTKVKDDEPEPDDADEPDAVDDDDVDLDALATAADDDDDDDAANTLFDIAEPLGIDPNEIDTWAEVVDAIREAQDAAEPEADADDVDADADEPEAEGDDGDAADEGDEWTREELTGKTLGELRAIARDNEIPTRGLKASQIIDALMGED